MKKFKIVIIISAVLVIIGIALTFYESQLINGSVINQQQNLLPGASMTLTKDLDPSKNQNGVYSIQITDFQKEDNIKVSILSPVGETVISKSITKSQIQENFIISTSGTYKIQIENQGSREIQILAVIGNYPQNIALIDMCSFILLITGLSGLAIGIMYLVKNRGKTNIN
ncbi:MAG TPA: hypothetical protein VEU72_02640 [Nitrosopumilaceae archaeon]|nr:hypothetical protein [Nitrosopumilaceae archaeon]